MGKYNIVHVNVFDGTNFSNGHVIVNGEEIGENRDAAGSEPINGNGGFLIPGLIDCHVHISCKEELETMRDNGVTTGLDMECWPIEKLDSLRGLDGLPTVKSAGLAAQYQRVGNWPEESKVETREDAHMFVGDRVRDRVDYIKIIADPPPFPPDTRGIDEDSMRELVNCAKMHGMKTIAHATQGIGFTLALKTGVDIITHAPLIKGLDGGQAELDAVAHMLALQRVAVPTLIMMKGTAEGLKTPPRGMKYEHAAESVAAMHKLGVPILAGTDCNVEEEAPCQPKHGIDLHTELKMLVDDAGLSNVEALRAATVLPAQYFDLPDRGVLAKGYRADMVLLAGDPTKDIANTRKIERVWIGGQMFVPKKHWSETGN
jgi:imidazolonepropionase-like amidohydrolase